MSDEAVFTRIYADDDVHAVLRDMNGDVIEMASLMSDLAITGGTWVVSGNWPDPFTADEPDMRGVCE